MKSIKQTKRRFLNLEKRLRNLKSKFNKLDVDDQMGRAGFRIRDQIIETQGMMKALYWMIDSVKPKKHFKRTNPKKKEK